MSHVTGCANKDSEAKRALAPNLQGHCLPLEWNLSHEFGRRKHKSFAVALDDVIGGYEAMR